ncbi:MAG TPA: ATP-binding protein [Bryobacteraceae bacterium]|nr:ATP-binding protein [Bryobacteraceae bacterium]
MAELLVRSADGSLRSVRLPERPLSLGRAQDNDLSFPDDAGLSRWHLRIEPHAEGWTVTDLGSKNGTFVNGVPVAGSQRLVPGDRIRAGGVVITFDAGDLPEARAPEMTVSLADALAAPAADSSGVPRALRVFARAARELALRRPLAELYPLALDLALETVNAERGLLLGPDEQGHLTVQAVRGERVRVSETVRQRVIGGRTSLLVEDTLQDAALASSSAIAGSGLRSLMAAPLQTEDQVLGLIYVDTPRSGERFTAEDLNLLTVLAGVASIQIERERWESQRRALVAEHITTLERLAAVLSHELNSPLGALKSTLDSLGVLALKQERAAPEQQQALADLQQSLRRTLAASIDRMQAVIARLQRFAHLDEAEVQTADLNELASDVIAMLGSEAPEGLAWEFYFGDLPAVRCRPRQLTAVFTILLRNAIEACRDTAGRIRVLTRTAGSEAVIEVADSGRGIGPEELERVFDPGFRVVGGRVAAGNWSLFGARQIIRSHGGDIRIASQPGKGTTVEVRLPLERAPRSGL